MLHHFGEQGLVSNDVGFEVLERILVEIHVGPGVAAERISGCAPGFEDGEILGLGFECPSVHEAVGGRDVSVVESGKNFCGDLGASFAWWQWTVGREIVEGKGDARSLGVGGRDKKEARNGDERESETPAKDLIWGTEKKHEGSPGQTERSRTVKVESSRNGMQMSNARARG